MSSENLTISDNNVLWGLWRVTPRDGKKPLKQPISPDGGVTAPELAMAHPLDVVLGMANDEDILLGYRPAPDSSWIAGDLDGCVDPETGAIADWARHLLGKHRGWAVTISGTGIRWMMRRGEGDVDRGHAGERNNVGFFAAGTRSVTVPLGLVRMMQDDPGAFERDEGLVNRVVAWRDAGSDAPGTGGANRTEADRRWHGHWMNRLSAQDQEEAVRGMLASLPREYLSDYEKWRDISMALHDLESRVHWNVGIAWEDWSRQSNHYDQDQNDYLWSRFKVSGSVGGYISFATLLHHAKTAGRADLDVWASKAKNPLEAARERLNAAKAIAGMLPQRDRDRQPVEGLKQQSSTKAMIYELTEYGSISGKDADGVLRSLRATDLERLVAGYELGSIEEALNAHTLPELADLLDGLDGLEAEREAEELAADRRLALEQYSSTAGREADMELLEWIPDGPFRELVDWVYSWLERDTPELAVMAAIAGLSAGMSEYAVQSSNNVTPMSIWALGLAPSGVGKSYAERCIRMIVEGMGASMQAWPGSGPGIYHALEHSAGRRRLLRGATKRPMMACMVDEMAFLLKAGNTPGTVHVQTAMKMMLELYNKGTQGQLGEQFLASRIREAVSCPYVTMSGFAPVKTYLDNVTSDMMDTGWAGRMLTFIVDYEARERDWVGRRRDPMPADLGAALRALDDGSRVARYRDRGSRSRAGFFEEPYAGPDNTSYWTRTIWMSDDQQRRVLRAQKRLVETLQAHAVDEVAARRYAENVAKVAGLMSMLDYAADVAAVVDPGEEVPLYRWPYGQMQVLDHNLDYAIWMVERVILKSLKALSDKMDRSEYSLMLDYVVDVAVRGLQRPDEGKAAKRALWSACLRCGVIPEAYLREAFQIGRKGDFPQVMADLAAMDRFRPVPPALEQQVIQLLGANFAVPTTPSKPRRDSEQFCRDSENRGLPRLLRQLKKDGLGPLFHVLAPKEGV